MILNYPDEVWIELGTELNINGTIYDAESDTKDLNFSINNDNLSTGEYFIKLKTKNKLLKQKVILIK